MWPLEIPDSTTSIGREHSSLRTNSEQGSRLEQCWERDYSHISRSGKRKATILETSVRVRFMIDYSRLAETINSCTS